MMGRSTRHNPPIDQIPERIRPGVVVLLQAIEYALQTSGEPWEFAVEIDELTAVGLGRNDFRWLVRKGLVVHQREITQDSDDGRAFQPTGDLTFPERTCFVLTDTGMSAAHDLLAAPNSNSANGSSPNHADGRASNEAMLNGTPSAGRKTRVKPSRPKWDMERRLLSLNGTIVKHFKWSAVNQEAILSAFEEEGWPPRIDDPLPPHAEQSSKRRLSDTIKCLNRKQENSLIHFRGDGTGEGITWEIVE